ncbi:MAG: nitronate monooxygenase family protein [Armatimonadetes bacterium]|nr:nitronate monooxygenase family protein [Armatimonadota bacterium]
MSFSKLPALRIADLEINPPIIQGGMGVRVSGARLAAAVANEGCAGVIASVGLGRFEDSPGSQFVKLNDDALRSEIRRARSLSKGIIGVNVMVALSNYENLIQVAAEEKVDFIVSGAGLPLELPGLVEDRGIKLIPIVSSARALRIICSKWKKYDRMPDAVILEGPRAGGHLGFKHDDLDQDGQSTLEDLLVETVELANTYDPPIPVIAAGGVYDGADIVRMLELGASGVQMATRFVCTEECDVDDRFKAAYVNASANDVTIIHSPVGMPARVIRNAFVDRISRGETMPFRCEYRCLKTCDPSTAPYCIAKVLANASKGIMEESFAFAGSNAPRCTEIVTVKELIKQLVDDAEAVQREARGELTVGQSAG